jgi:phytoene dehydrogenase-like protein
MHDVIIVGGGHNGMTCAAYLARAGKRVLVVEARHRLGFAAGEVHTPVELPVDLGNAPRGDDLVVRGSSYGRR